MARTSWSRVTALIGPAGSGKSELAIALATDAVVARKGGTPHVALVDLDVLKPYFRAREAAQILRAAGVELLAPEGVLAVADLPIIPPTVRGAISRADMRVVIDVGGDPVGARALGSLADVMTAAPHDLLLIISRHRPFAGSFDEIMATAAGLAGASGLKITGVVANTHMMEATTVEDVRWGLDLSRQVATALAVELRLVMIPEGLAEAEELPLDLPPIVIVKRRMTPVFMGGVVLKSSPRGMRQVPGS
ncbi:MAG: hypothetical protein HY903_00965 [Deltaproteobacteria bacterium]|nr:hypothetical protein [Deltaproteobacteria bacterium]